MLPITPKKKPVKKDRPLKPKAKPENLYAVAEYKKEITRLQKLLAKNEAKYFSEIEALKAKLAEEKKNKINVVLNRFGNNRKES